MNKITIAIDGYSSCGKSTIARALAAKLGYSYIDSGAMYRAATVFAIQENLYSKGKLDVATLIKGLDKIHITFHYNPQRDASDTYLNGENIENQIRGMEVSERVSEVSSIKEVRAKMRLMQQEFGKHKGVVMDGRDIGTVVFPNAELKIFMNANLDIRSLRRFEELKAKGETAGFGQIKENLVKRDYDDTHRKEDPLTKAPDAIELDNSDLTREQQLNWAIDLVNKVAK
jgi:cytidylate kinase